MLGPHPAIDALREATDLPTMGIMEASVLYALPLGASFSIVTTSARWAPLLEARDAVKKAIEEARTRLGPDPPSDIVAREIDSVLHTDDRVQREFGIPAVVGGADLTQD